MAGLWTFLDLFWRAELPGAAALSHLAFRAVSVPLRALRLVSNDPLLPLLPVAALLGALSWRRPERAALYWAIPTVLLVGAEVVLVALACLLERSAGAGLIVAVTLALGLRLWRPAGSEGSDQPTQQRSPRRVIALAVGCAVLCMLLVDGLYDTQAQYPLLLLAGDALREGRWSPQTVFLTLDAGLLVVAAIVVLRRRGQGQWPLPWLAACIALGLLAGVGLHSFSSDPAPLWTVLLTTPTAILLVWIATPFVPSDAARTWDLPTTWLPVLLPLLAPALLLFGQSYACRILHCPAPSSVPGLERIAIPPEVFRIALDTTAERALLAVRGSSELMSMRLQPEPGPLTPVDPGPLAAMTDEASASQLLGSPEELIYVPSTGRWLGALLPGDEESTLGDVEDRFPSGGACEGAGDFGSLLFETDKGATRIERVFTIPELCWVSSMHWDEVREEVLLGWEYRAGFHRFDPRSRQWSAHEPGEGFGDVISFAQDPDPESGALFTTSLWTSRHLSKLDPRTSEITRSVALGGTNYEIVLDAERDRLYISSFYGSRVRVVNSQTLEPEGTFPTGFGTRALAVVPRLNLLLVSSVYDGTLRVRDLEQDKELASLRVGGHVKHFAVDQRRGQALFWSQCGLYRLDLEALLGRAP